MDTQISEASVAGICPECDEPYSRLAADGFTCPCGWTEGNADDGDPDENELDEASSEPEAKPKRASKTKAASEPEAQDELARTLTENGQYDAAGKAEDGEAGQEEEGEGESPLVGEG